MKKYRFFFHYHRQKKMTSIHFRNKCHFIKPSKFRCYVPCEGKENKRQPYFVMQGWANSITFKDGFAIIV